MEEQHREPCDKADRIASAYAARYDWADAECLKLYFRLELVNDTLRDIAAGVHEQILPGVKGWSVAVLRALFMASGNRLSHAEIGAQTRVPPANVTYHVDVLQQDGYVTRVPHETDRRIRLVELTPLGKETCEQLIPARARLINRMGECFTQSELNLLNEFLSRLQGEISTQDWSNTTDGYPVADKQE